VNQLKSPIIWRLILWVLLLTLMVPLGTVLVFVRGDIHNFFAQQDQANLEEQANFLFREINTSQKESQKIIEAFSNRNKTAFILDKNGNYLNHSNPQKIGTSAVSDLGSNLLQQIISSPSAIVDGNSIAKIIKVAGTLPDGSTLVVMLDSANRIGVLDSLTNKLIFQLMLSLAIAAIVGGVASIVILLNPLVKLSRLANALGSGRYETEIRVEDYRGEIAILAANLKKLSSTVKDSLSQLERRVDERTGEIDRRSNLLKAVAEVGRGITSYRNLSELLQQTTQLIRENFGYYHVGIFLLDDRKEYAVLTAANSEGGQRMLEKKHQLKVGETGIVGYVTKNLKARIALDVGNDAVYFNNPDLPLTRSEMALPLVVGGQILGALDVQSTEPQAFTEEDIATLQIMAEQLAVAIQNANLFNETEKALEASKFVYGEVSREAWSKIIHNQPRIGYIATTPKTVQINDETLEPTIAKAFETGDVIIGSDNLTITVPVKVRGLPVGAIRLKKNEISEAWTQEETNLAIALSEQISGALESARLYRESQQRAARESLVSDISARISAFSNTEAIMRETVQELGQTIGNASVTFQLMEQFEGQQKADGLKNGNTKPDVTRKARA
jgi:GAF domain-containing protein/HAMP domain-containing protein